MFSITPRSLASSAVVALAATLLAPVATASAATSGTGYVRVAHLSPDTLEVDVSLSALSGGTVLYSLSDVGYGGVSDYMALDPGTYAIAMRPAGADPTSTPVVEASIDVTADAAATVIAMGPNSDLETTVIDDDLTAPSADSSRVRVFQASVAADTVAVSAEDGTELTAGARFGDVGDYVELPSGPTEFSLVSGDREDVASTDLAAGAAQTLFVLDDSSGALTIVPAVDSAAVTQAPIGGVDAGGGALAAGHEQLRYGAVGGAAGLAALLLLGAVIRARSGARAFAPAHRGDRR